jgi:hypothetical protein
MGEPRLRNAITLLRKAGSAGLLLLALGCTSDNSSRDTRHDDPILGIGARPANQAAAVSTSTPVTSAQGGAPTPAYRPSPPLTAATPTSSANNGGFQPLQNGNDLRIGAPAPAANAQPVPGVTAVPPPGAPTTAPSTPIGMPATTSNTLDQAYAAVQARNPLAYSMTFNSQTNEYTFLMKVPSKLNSAAIQSVEASAATPVDAIKRTLEQLSN